MSDRSMYAELVRAEQLIELHRHAEAEAILRRLIAQSPDDADPQFMLAECLLATERYKDAAHTVEAALATDPHSAWGHRIRAFVMKRHKNPEESLRSANEAIRLEPDVALNYIVLAEVAVAAKQHKEALDAAEHAITIEPENPATHSAAGYVLLNSRKWKQAEAHVRKALELDPQLPDALNNLGIILDKRGKRNEALSAFARSSQADPRDATARNNAKNALGIASGIGIGLFTVVRVVTVGPARSDDLGWVGVVIAAALGLALGVVLLKWRHRRQERALDSDVRAFIAAHRQDRRARLADITRWKRAIRPVAMGLGGSILGLTLALQSNAAGWMVLVGMVLLIGSPIAGLLLVLRRP